MIVVIVCFVVYLLRLFYLVEIACVWLLLVVGLDWRLLTLFCLYGLVGLS